MQLDLGCRSEPEVRAFQSEEIGGKFWQLARAGKRRAVHQERWENFSITVFARVNVEEEIRKGTFEPRSPAFINRETSSGHFGGGFQIQDSCALADFPVRLGLEVKFWRHAPAPDLFVLSGATANGNRSMRHVGNGQQQFALAGVECGNSFVGPFYTLRDLLHFRNEGVRVLFFLLQAGDFVAGLVALGFELFGGSDQFAAFFVERAETIQIEGHAALLRHLGKDVQVLAEVTEIMHGVKRIP